ncbi:protein cordon-bleu [Lampris incognitus]|uniref:protein cordon-bleu n=1 Tax=Lampris incognitus TaxID=2546036 RepID=UPI0024B5652C|nr:protein cordon-bleu [Lampris incognitus]
MEYSQASIAAKPPLGRKMKGLAPPPPQAPEPAPRRIFRNAVPDGGGIGATDAKENMLRASVDIHLTLPQGYKTTITENGSKALMDLLVELCSRYHLNPALHTLELLSPEGHPLGFKPNALLGSLNVACVLIKEKVYEEKVARRPAPKVPEKTVRLVVNYHRSQKAVVRVNPLVPLQTLVPVICDKCEFDPAHVLLLKDGVSRHELPLDKSLTQLGIKELYVHDQSLVLQPKMASAPALNYSDTFRSSTSSLGGAEKKGLLGIFKFNRRKSKTEVASMDMDNTDDKVADNTDRHSNGLSTVSVVPCIEIRPSTLGQSQSVMNISRMSPKTEPKKRRAPVPPVDPTPPLGYYSFEGYQVDPGSESQQRKRKAPAPPPTPISITPGPDDTSTSTTPNPDSCVSETPKAASCTKAVHTATVSSTTVVTAIAVSPTVSAATMAASPKTVAQPSPVFTSTPVPSSPAPSSTTADSLAIQDSSSEFSHTIDDSDSSSDPAGSLCSTSSCSSSSRVDVSALARAPPTTSGSALSSQTEPSEQASSEADQSDQETAGDSSMGSETESALNLKLEEVENNRHSAIAWLHSLRRSVAGSRTPDADVAKEETLSMGSSSGGSSLPDQGYAASESTAEGEDSGLVSSPSDTQPTSPDGSLSLDGSSAGGGGERSLRPLRDNSSDSDEGCATWGSRHRHSAISLKEKSGIIKDSYDGDHELTAQIKQTLADFEADLDIMNVDVVNRKEIPDTLSIESNEVPVSLVDMDIPITAIDEVLEEYGQNTAKEETKPHVSTQSKDSTGSNLCCQFSGDLENKNNNACTAGENNKSSNVNTQQPPQAVQHRKSLANKSVAGADKTKQTSTTRTKPEDRTMTNNKTAKEEKQTTAPIKSGDVQKQSENGLIKAAPAKSSSLTFPEKKHNLTQTGQKLVSKEEDVPVYRVGHINTNTTSSHSKITQSPTSRFGMKTFTVVPPKPTVTGAVKEKPATLTVGAIKIDDLGNMVKAGISHNKHGSSSELAVSSSKESPLLGKAKAFWSSTERQCGAIAHTASLCEKTKEDNDYLKNTAVAETAMRAAIAHGSNTVQGFSHGPSERAKPKESTQEKVNEQVKKVVEDTKEEKVKVGSGVSVSENLQQPNNKPPPTIPLLLPDQKKDLSFLKPSRRTSSQYVASAIARYTPHTLAKPDSIPNIPESSVSLKTQSFGYQRGGRSICMNPQQLTNSSSSDNGPVSHAAGPKRSVSYPECFTEGPRSPEETPQDRAKFVRPFGSTNKSSTALSAEAVNSRHIIPSSPTQVNVVTSDDKANIKHIQARGPSPTQNQLVQSSPKQSQTTQVTGFKKASQAQPSTNKETASTSTHPVLGKKPEPFVTVSSGSVLPEPQQVTVFGPVKKFRPVISKSVQKETCLHSSLMEAIQTGGGKGRLKKLSSSGPSSLKKSSYTEEENERSVLLAAIRAQSSSGRLKKTKSEAADELQKFRKATEEETEKKSGVTVCDSGPPASPPSSSPAIAPSPSAPIGVPPPPPAPTQFKPSTVVHPGSNTQMNAASAREAMLEAIRTGSAAEKLKKVTAPTKTIQVNGRLGTIQATSPTLVIQ